MITRVTTMMRVTQTQRNLSDVTARLAELQKQGTSLKRLNRASDDPSGTAASMQVRQEMERNSQYQRNISDGTGWLTTVDSALTSVNQLLSHARDLTVQGANDGAMSQTAKNAIADELDSVKDSLLRQANSQYLGRNVFAGTSDAGYAYDASYAFTGGTGTVERRVSDDSTVRVDQDGSQVFGVGAVSAFAALDRISADLRAGVNVTARIGDIDGFLQRVRTAQSTVGARQSGIDQTQGVLKTRAVELEGKRSEIEDIDIPTIALQLTAQQTTYQAALSVTAHALDHNLMDYLR